MTAFDNAAMSVAGLAAMETRFLDLPPYLRDELVVRAYLWAAENARPFPNGSGEDTGWVQYPSLEELRLALPAIVESLGSTS